MKKLFNLFQPLLSFGDILSEGFCLGHRWIDLELVYEGLLLLVVTITTSASDSSISELFCELASQATRVLPR